MYKETIAGFAESAAKKYQQLAKQPLRYLMLSALAGIYVGFGVILALSVGAPLSGSGAMKMVMGASFGIALTLVIFAGSELFTGNNMIMTIGSLSNKCSWLQTLKLWLLCYIGNLLGALLLAWLYVTSGLGDMSFIENVTVAKMNAPFIELLARGILCNMLVCLAVWTCARTKEDSAKLILIFWCLFAFVASGFEHSVANMTLLAIPLLAGTTETAISWGGYARNLLPVSLGNIIGGALFLGYFYWHIARGEDAS